MTAPGVEPAGLDVGHLALFLGLRVNALVRQRLVAAGFSHVRESHGYVVQHFIDADRSITELAARMGVSQQAASKVVAELADLGVLRVAAGADRRAKRVALSARGREAVQAARRARATVDARLARALGADYDAVRSGLVRGLRALGGVTQIRRRAVRAPQ